jgi:hypothetical protein
LNGLTDFGERDSLDKQVGDDGDADTEFEDGTQKAFSTGHEKGLLLNASSFFCINDQW